VDHSPSPPPPRRATTTTTTSPTTKGSHRRVTQRNLREKRTKAQRPETGERERESKWGLGPRQQDTLSLCVCTPPHHHRHQHCSLFLDWVEAWVNTRKESSAIGRSRRGCGCLSDGSGTRFGLKLAHVPVRTALGDGDDDERSSHSEPSDILSRGHHFFSSSSSALWPLWLESITSHGQPPPPRGVVEDCGRLPLGFPRSALVVCIGLPLKETNSNMPWLSALRLDALQIVTTKGPSSSSTILRQCQPTTLTTYDHHLLTDHNKNNR
jgi:hypothetical protein